MYLEHSLFDLLYIIRCGLSVNDFSDKLIKCKGNPGLFSFNMKMQVKMLDYFICNRNFFYSSNIFSNFDLNGN